MDTNIRLEDDVLLKGKTGVKRVIETLNKKNIWTVDEFINTDLSDIVVSASGKQFYRVLQELYITRYKKTPFLYDCILKKNYTHSEWRDFGKDMLTLGFYSKYPVYFDKYINRKGLVYYKDILSEISSSNFNNSKGILAYLLLNYVENNLVQENETFDKEQELLSYIDELRVKKNEIDKKIALALSDLEIIRQSKIGDENHVK